MRLRMPVVIKLSTLLLAIVVITGSAMAATLVVDNSDNSVNCEGTEVTYPTIQEAVYYANPGDTIDVCPGTYVEQVLIQTDGLTLESVSGPGTLNPDGAVIKAPDEMYSPKVIVYVDGATGVTIQDFEITGPGPGTCASLDGGILVGNELVAVGQPATDNTSANVSTLPAGQATISGNLIENITDSTFGGCQDGFGIIVGDESGDVGSAIISDNTIENYQKGGILVSGAGSNATIIGNIITGVGKTPVIAQNGVQISDNAVAAITSNTVSDNVFDTKAASCAAVSAAHVRRAMRLSANSNSNCGASAVGVLEFNAGAKRDARIIKKHNQVRNNQVNVLVIPAAP